MAAAERSEERVISNLFFYVTKLQRILIFFLLNFLYKCLLLI